MCATHDPEVAFKDADIAILVGARPRSKGMERSDLLQANAEIFKTQGAALNKVASRDVKVLVVGNPANTNAYIAMKSAPDLPAKNFTALMRLDQNRALSQLAGSAIIEARGLSSAASAANAIIDQIHDWVIGSNGEWVTMGVPSDGSYGIPEEIVFGFPMTCENGEYTIVQDLPIDEFSQQRINQTLAELEEEKAEVSSLL